LYFIVFALCNRVGSLCGRMLVLAERPWIYDYQKRTAFN
jgi:hypothetical protein